MVAAPVEELQGFPYTLPPRDATLLSPDRLKRIGGATASVLLQFARETMQPQHGQVVGWQS